MRKCRRQNRIAETQTAADHTAAASHSPCAMLEGGSDVAGVLGRPLDWGESKKSVQVEYNGCYVG